jgi:hypothetical protein
MIRGAVAFLSTLVFVFSVAFVVAHSMASEPAKPPRLVAVPASESAAADGPLRVSTLGHAAPLPALRRAPAGASAALIADSPASSPSPPPASSLRANAASPPVD